MNFDKLIDQYKNELFASKRAEIYHRKKMELYLEEQEIIKETLEELYCSRRSGEVNQ